MQTRVIDLGFRPREWQTVAFKGMHGKRFGCEVVHRRGGKTVKAVIKLVDAALRFTGERGRFGYIAPQLKQAKGVAWDYLKGFALKVPGTECNESELWVQFPNGARIRLFGADNPDALRGLYFDGVVLDEVAQMKLEVWGEIIQPALADRKGWALFIGTPKGVNLFSEIYQNALANPNDWYVGLWDVYRTGALDDVEIERLKSEMTDAQFRQEMLCDFQAANDDALISIAEVTEATARAYKQDAYGHAAKVVGIDVARFGGDRSVLFHRQGLVAFEPKVWMGLDTMTLAANIAHELERINADAVNIDGSPASYGVIDRLKQLGYTVNSIDFGGKPTMEKYQNKRAEMWHKMSLWIREGGAIPDNIALRTDLCAPLFDYSNTAGKMALEKKDDIRERIGVSPDMGDALALTFAVDAMPRHMQHRQTNYLVAGVSYAGDDIYNPLG